MRLEPSILGLEGVVVIVIREMSVLNKVLEETAQKTSTMPAWHRRCL